MLKVNLSLALASLSILILFTIFALGYVNSVFSATAEHAVISEVQIGSAGLSNDEFVELYNPTSSAIDISGWTVSRKTAAGTEHELLATIPATTEIGAHMYYLIAHSEYDGGVVEDLMYTEDGALANNNSIYIKDASSNVIDKLGLGTSNDPETSSKGNPSTGSSVERKANSDSTAESMTTGADVSAGNGEDSNDNSADFVNRTTPDPQNSDSSAEPAVDPSPTPTDSPSPTPSESPSPSPSESPTPSPSETATPTPTPSPSPTPSKKPFSSISFFSCSVRFVNLNFGFRKVEMPMLVCG